MGELIRLYEFDEQDRDFGDSFPAIEPIRFPRRKTSALQQSLGLALSGLGWIMSSFGRLASQSMRGFSPRGW